MSDTSNPAGDDAGSRFTVEDSGSTTDAADLVHDDQTIAASQAGSIGRTTSASGRSEPRADSDPGAPEAPGSPEPPQAPTSEATVGDVAPLEDTEPVPVVEPVSVTAPVSGTAPVDDFAIGHVFDQTNGVIDGLDGDSDGTAESDVLGARDRADDDPAFEAHAEVEPQPEGGVDDTRVTGN